MKRNENEELQSRREFFKKAAKGALPILGISLFGTSILTACGDDDEPQPQASGCGNSCSGSCSSGCSGSCDNSCSGNCDSCKGTCDSTGCTYY